MPSLNMPGANLLFEVELAETVTNSFTGKSVEYSVLCLSRLNERGDTSSRSRFTLSHVFKISGGHILIDFVP